MTKKDARQDLTNKKISSDGNNLKQSNSKVESKNDLLMKDELVDNDAPKIEKISTEALMEVRQLPVDNVRKLGQVVETESIIWLTGAYYGKDIYPEKLIISNIPCFGIMERKENDKTIFELILIYSEKQKADLLVNNVRLEEMNSLDAFYDGIQDMFNQCQFFGIRIATFLDGDEVDTKIPEIKAQPQWAIIEAGEEHIKKFLSHKDYNFIRHFTNKIDNFIIILQGLYRLLAKYEEFDKQLFLERVSEILALYKSDTIARMFNLK